MKMSGFVEDEDCFEKVELLRESGGTSLSYLVRINGKQYFMKQLRPKYAGELRYRTAFYKEYDTGRKICNRHIVRYERIGENADGLYLLMEHINGPTLEERLEADPAWFAREKNVERMLRQLLEGLNTLHEHNVAYLDLSPHNIMFAQVSGEVKIVDLGFCFADGYGHTAGRTLGFAAPELMERRMEEVDARTDIYAVGRLLQYIKERAHAKYSHRLERIMQRCLKADKHERFESVKELRKALNQKSRIMRAAATIGCIIVAASSVWGWQQFKGTEDHRQLMLYVEKDFEVGGIYYVITSEDSATYMAIGRKRVLGHDHETGDVSVYFAETMEFDGREYRLTEIANSAFSGYTDIASVSFPSTLERIGEWAFHGDSSLVYANIPEGVKEISVHSFRGTGLRSVKLPKSLRTIENAAFVDNLYLKEVIIPEGVESLGVDAFGGCRAMQRITLPSTLKTIRRGVFWKCCSLKEISIPAGVETIGEYAFFYCDSLQHVYNHSPEPQDVSAVFNRKDITIHVPAASVEKYRNAQHWKNLRIVGDL